MSKVGGYKIIDLENKELTLNVGMVYDGIYDKIEQTRKPILLSGLNIEGKEYHDFYVVPEVVGNTFVMYTHDFLTGSPKYTISVTDTDKVTVTSRG